MSSTELEEYLNQEPLPDLRMTLSSGDQLIVRETDRPVVTGLVMVLRNRNADDRVTGPSRLVSIPNIVLVEPIESRPDSRRRRHR